MFLVIAFVGVFAVGFGAGRVHHIASLEAKIAKHASSLKAEEVALVAKAKALLNLK